MIYVIQAVIGGPVKIGFTECDPRFRLSALQCGSPFKLRLLKATYGDKAVERALHHRFAILRQHGEWFDPQGELADWIDGKEIDIAYDPGPPPVYGPLMAEYQEIVDELQGSPASAWTLCEKLDLKVGPVTARLRSLRDKWHRVSSEAVNLPPYPRHVRWSLDSDGCIVDAPLPDLAELKRNAA